MSEPRLRWERRKTKITSVVGDPEVHDLIHDRQEGKDRRPVVVGTVQQEGGMWRGRVVGDQPSASMGSFRELHLAKDAVRRRAAEKLR